MCIYIIKLVLRNTIDIINEYCLPLTRKIGLVFESEMNKLDHTCQIPVIVCTDLFIFNEKLIVLNEIKISKGAFIGLLRAFKSIKRKSVFLFVTGQ